MRARKVDQTQRSIVRALRRAGCLVWCAGGAVDLVVSRGERVFLLEAKTPRVGRLTRTQAQMLAEGWPIAVVRDEDEALRAVGAAPVGIGGAGRSAGDTA